MWLAVLQQASDGVVLNLAALGAVAAGVAGALSFMFRTLLASKDAQIKECESREARTEARGEARLDALQERFDREVAEERARTKEALHELHDALGVAGASVDHAERAVEAVRGNNSGGRR